MTRQAIVVGFPHPNYINETGTQDTILQGGYLDHTSGVTAITSRMVGTAEFLAASSSNIGAFSELIGFTLTYVNSIARMETLQTILSSSAALIEVIAGKLALEALARAFDTMSILSFAQDVP